MSKSARRLLYVFAILSILLSQVRIIRVAAAGPFQVNSTADEVDALPGDGVCETGPGNGVCTLRAAAQEANATTEADSITIPAGIYTLTISGTDEDEGATGDLDITQDVSIYGAGAAQFATVMILWIAFGSLFARSALPVARRSLELERSGAKLPRSFRRTNRSTPTSISW